MIPEAEVQALASERQAVGSRVVVALSSRRAAGGDPLGPLEDSPHTKSHVLRVIAALPLTVMRKKPLF